MVRVVESSAYNRFGSQGFAPDMFKRLFKSNKPPEPMTELLQVGDRSVPLLMVHHPRARRYLLRLCPNGTVRVTVPRQGTRAAAKEFALRNVPWLEQQFQRLSACPKAPAIWSFGTEILFRGEPVRIENDTDGVLRLGGERLIVPAGIDLRPHVEKHLRKLAARELPPRVMELAALHGVSVARVSVRNQRSRWGSCSRLGTISLNWRLIQAPGFVSDYIILHELAHRRHMNHSGGFWQEVARLCPDYLQAERWLRQRGRLLR